jgi:hypothetical protein
MTNGTYSCWGCGQNHTSWNNNYCSACQQTKKLESVAKENREHQDRIASERTAEIRRQARQIVQDRADREYYAEQAREEAYQQASQQAAYNSRLQAESNISAEDAYRCGFVYEIYDFSSNNFAKLRVFVTETGSISWTWNEIYELPHLRQQFSLGLSSWLNKVRGPGKDYMLAQARQAGYEVGMGTLAPRFKLNTNNTKAGGLEGVGGEVEIGTKTFTANDFQRLVDEETGVISFSYSGGPFKDQAMKNAFNQGLNDAASELNTSDLIADRLQNEIAETKKARAKEVSEQKQAKFQEKWNKAVEFIIKLGFVASGLGLAYWAMM